MNKLQPGAFNRLLSADGPVGQHVAWRRSHACPCVSPSSGQAAAACPICNAKGRIWDAEKDGSCGASAQAAQKAFAPLGMWEPGDVLLTVPSDSPVYGSGMFDRIRLKDATNPFSMVVIPGLNDRLIGSIVYVDRLFWLADDGASMVEGQPPAVSATGELSWPAGAAPPEGKQFSLSGIRHDEYYVFRDLAGDRNAGVKGLPRKLHARRFDLFSR